MLGLAAGVRLDVGSRLAAGTAGAVIAPGLVTSAAGDSSSSEDRFSRKSPEEFREESERSSFLGGIGWDNLTFLEAEARRIYLSIDLFLLKTFPADSSIFAWTALVRIVQHLFTDLVGVGDVMITRMEEEETSFGLVFLVCFWLQEEV